jgi:CubicO group peptidase (beta-lactamase class C family)
MKLVTRFIACLFLACAGAASARSAELPVARPELVGMSAAKLGQIDAAVKKLIDAGRISGAVTIVARRGKVVHFKSHGVSDVSTQRPMSDDTIFRDCSSEIGFW